MLQTLSLNSLSLTAISRLTRKTLMDFAQMAVSTAFFMQHAIPAVGIHAEYPMERHILLIGIPTVHVQQSSRVHVVRLSIFLI
eukprot:COSAG02_NODE_687_length_18478_cov_23.093476_9_plen_83_part_00